MFSGAFGSPRKIWILGQNLAILLCISLAVTPAFKMRFWNIGAEGQVLAGGLAAAACMICLGDKVPNGLLIVLIVIAEMCIRDRRSTIRRGRRSCCRRRWRCTYTC